MYSRWFISVIFSRESNHTRSQTQRLFASSFLNATNPSEYISELPVTHEKVGMNWSSPVGQIGTEPYHPVDTQKAMSTYRFLFFIHTDQRNRLLEPAYFFILFFITKWIFKRLLISGSTHKIYALPLQ